MGQRSYRTAVSGGSPGTGYLIDCAAASGVRPASSGAGPKRNRSARISTQTYRKDTLLRQTRGADMDRAVRFYSSTLGLKLADRFGNHWASVERGRGLTIGLLQPRHKCRGRKARSRSVSN
jgi:hypothetical protein